MGLLHLLRHPRKAYKEYLAREKEIIRPRGIDKDKIYYVIRCNLPECGLFAIYTYILDHIAYAVDHGYIPVIDSEQYPCLYKENEPVHGVTDPWLYYFKPMQSRTLAELKRVCHVIYGRIYFPHYKAIYYYRKKKKNVLPDRAAVRELKEYVDRYMPLRDDLKEKLENKVACLKRFGKILGIHVRGTDMYTEGKQHPIPTGKTKDFSVIDEIIKKHGIDSIFLCTDTESTVALFKQKYGDRVITTTAVRQSDDSKGGIHKDATLGNGRKYHKYLLGEEVITDMYMLSKCDVLICGPSNVAFVAIVNNGGKYEHIYYYA